MSDYTNLFYSIKSQNEALANTKKELTDRYSIDDKRIEYQTGEIGSIKYINNILFYFYFLLVAVIVFIFIFSKKEIPIAFRLFIVICFVSYPFIILWLEGLIYESFKYTFAIITGKVYEPPSKPLTISSV